MLDPAKRAAAISEQAHALAKEAKLELVEDEALLAENAGLDRMAGRSDGLIRQIVSRSAGRSPDDVDEDAPEVFLLRETRSKKLANKFLLVSNLVAKDGGLKSSRQRKGHPRPAVGRQVLLGQDLKHPLGEMAGKLAGITFHEKLGRKRIASSASSSGVRTCRRCDAVPEDARRAAGLAKADLVSEMVGEFPELQGLMGRYYAEQSASSRKSPAPSSCTTSPRARLTPCRRGPGRRRRGRRRARRQARYARRLLGDRREADRSGDPYQLRRAALGVIRIVLENDLRLPLMSRSDAK